MSQFSRSKKASVKTPRSKAQKKVGAKKGEEEAALQRISASVNSSLKQLNLNYTHARRQAELWSRISSITASLGFLVLLTGIVVMIAGHVTPGIVTSALGAITEGATVLLFRQSKEASKRVDENQRNLEKVQKVHDAITLWERMKPGHSRDQLMETIIQKAFATESVIDKPLEAQNSSAGSDRGVEGTVTINNSRLDGTSGDIVGVKISGERKVKANKLGDKGENV